MSNLGLGAVVTVPVSPVGIGLEELLSPSGGNPCLLAEPSCEMTAVECAGSDLGRPLPEDIHREVAEYLVRGDDPGVGDELRPGVRDDEDVPENI